MNINNLTRFFTQNTQDDVVYASSFRRAAASAIDAIIVLALRSLVVIGINILYLNKLWQSFFDSFYHEFGTRTIKRVPEHIHYVTNHSIFIITLLSIVFVILVGAVYHAYFNSSAKQGTLGKQLLQIKIVKEPNHDRISFSVGMYHYFLSVAPFLYVIYIANYQLNNKLSFFAAIANNHVNLLFGVIFIAWVHLHLITKKKTTAYDLICNTTLINK